MGRGVGSVAERGEVRVDGFVRHRSSSDDHLTVMVFDGAEFDPVPRLLDAETRKTSFLPGVRPVMVWVVAVERNVRAVRATPPTNGVTT